MSFAASDFIVPLCQPKRGPPRPDSVDGCILLVPKKNFAASRHPACLSRGGLKVFVSD